MIRLLLGSSLIRIHIVCFHDKIKTEVHMNICSRCKKQTVFSGVKIVAGEGFNLSLLIFCILIDSKHI